MVRRSLFDGSCRDCLGGAGTSGVSVRLSAPRRPRAHTRCSHRVAQALAGILLGADTCVRHRRCGIRSRPAPCDNFHARPPGSARELSRWAERSQPLRGVICLKPIGGGLGAAIAAMIWSARGRKTRQSNMGSGGLSAGLIFTVIRPSQVGVSHTPPAPRASRRRSHACCRRAATRPWRAPARHRGHPE